MDETEKHSEEHKVQVSLRLDAELHKAIKQIAYDNERTIPGEIIYVLKKHVRENRPS